VVVDHVGRRHVRHLLKLQVVKLPVVKRPVVKLREIKTKTFRPFTSFGGSVSSPLSSEYATYKTVKAIFWPWLEPFSVRTSVKTFKLFPPRFFA